MAGKDRLTEAHERLTAAVESLVSGEDWQQLLSLAARLYRYSTVSSSGSNDRTPPGWRATGAGRPSAARSARARRAWPS